MIKTEKIVKHTICCPHCGGKIKNMSAPDYDFDFTKNARNAHTVFSAYTQSLSPKMPTCTSCKKKFTMKVDTENFTIEIKDV